MKILFQRLKPLTGTSMFFRPFSAAARNLRPLKLVSLNCYLVPSLFSLRKVNNTCRFQKERAAMIGDFCMQAKTPFDLLVFQEMWGAGVDKIHAKLSSQYNLIPKLGNLGAKVDDEKTISNLWG
jgi:hypothetical protein